VNVKSIGWLAKWIAMGSLPKGQSLESIAGPGRAVRGQAADQGPVRIDA
jgi:hypothetical protein